MTWILARITPKCVCVYMSTGTYVYVCLYTLKKHNEQNKY